MSASDLYPYILVPKLTPAIWGGDALVTDYGKDGDPHAKIGESWECWDTNAVANGPLAGATIAELRSSLGAALLGDIDPSHIFPVLTKIIDAHDWLSVQVHPDDAYAERVEHQPNGKTECWLILRADEGAELVLGWTHDTSREEYLARVADGTLGEILRRVPVKAGEAYFLPAGSLHAIGNGIALFETQQASDLTYRIFDWNRTGTDGKPRELHVEKAADVLDYRRGTHGAIIPLDYRFDNLDRTALIFDRHFIVERIVATGEPASIPTGNRPIIVMALEHALTVACDGGSATLKPYQSALVPAGARWMSVIADDGGTAPFTMVTPPASPEEYAVRLTAAGVDQARIDAFIKQFTP